MNSYSKAKTSIEPTGVFRGHTSVVGVIGFPSVVPLELTFSTGRRLACPQSECIWQCWRRQDAYDVRTLFSITHSCLTDGIPAGTQDHQQNLLQKLKRTTGRSCLSPLALHPSISLSQEAQIRFGILEYHRCLFAHSLYRPPSSMTSGLRERNYMYSNLIRMKFFTCPGHHTILLFSRLHLVTGESISGIYHKSVSSRHLTIKKMDPPS